MQKHFEDDAFVEWCKYLTYFAEPKYLPYLSYVRPSSDYCASFPILLWRSLIYAFFGN